MFAKKNSNKKLQTKNENPFNKSLPALVAGKLHQESPVCTLQRKLRRVSFLVVIFWVFHHPVRGFSKHSKEGFIFAARILFPIHVRGGAAGVLGEVGQGWGRRGVAGGVPRVLRRPQCATSQRVCMRGEVVCFHEVVCGRKLGPPNSTVGALVVDRHFHLG